MNNKKLQQEWTRKLAESGFVDIENADGTLKYEVDPRTVSLALLERDSIEIYYELAREFLNGHQFETELEREIWVDHCEGATLRATATKYGRTVYKIRKLILRLRKIAKICK